MWMPGIDLLDELGSAGRGLKLLSALPQANKRTIKCLKTEGKRPWLSFPPPFGSGRGGRIELP